MEQQTEAQARALEPTLGNAASPASRRAVVQLARLPAELKGFRLACFAEWDLGNLVRCALTAGASANTRWGENDTPVLCYAAQVGSARSLKVLLSGGADVRLADKEGDTALHWAAQKGNMACVSLLLAAGAPLEAKGVSVPPGSRVSCFDSDASPNSSTLSAHRLVRPPTRDTARLSPSCSSAARTRTVWIV